MSSAAGSRIDCCASERVAVPPSDDLMTRLRELSLAVDTLWTDALSRSSENQVLEIGEASQGLHRAMIALDSFLAYQRASRAVAEAQ